MSCGLIGGSIGDCIKEGISSGMDSMAQTFKEGAEWAMKNLTTAWLKAPSPDVTSSTSVTGWIQAHLSYFVAATMVFSVLVASYRMATTGKFEHGRDLAESLTRVVLVTLLAGTLTTLGVQVGEAFSSWILDKANIDFSQTVMLAAAQNPGIIILLAIIVIIAQVIQLGLILIRNGMIVILAGVLPLAAAAGNTQMGRQWWQKSFAWLLAFVLYKPVAALIYAASFKMASKEQDLATQLSGIFMMLLAIFALPALMRFLVPATAAMSGGNAGAMAGAVAGAALATGAVLWPQVAARRPPEEPRAASVARAVPRQPVPPRPGERCRPAHHRPEHLRRAEMLARARQGPPDRLGARLRARPAWAAPGPAEPPARTAPQRRPEREETAEAQPRHRGHRHRQERVAAHAPQRHSTPHRPG